MHSEHLLDCILNFALRTLIEIFKTIRLRQKRYLFNPLFATLTNMQVSPLLGLSFHYVVTSTGGIAMNFHGFQSRNIH